MTKTEYLFGVKPFFFEGKEFYEVAKERVRLAKELKNKIVWDKDNQYNPGEKADVDERIKQINKAIIFWENILKERKEEDVNS